MDTRIHVLSTSQTEQFPIGGGSVCGRKGTGSWWAMSTRDNWRLILRTPKVYSHSTVHSVANKDVVATFLAWKENPDKYFNDTRRYHGCFAGRSPHCSGDIFLAFFDLCITVDLILHQCWKPPNHRCWRFRAITTETNRWLSALKSFANGCLSAGSEFRWQSV